MTEQKVKKRGWVKNAAIIFLSVMLVLTFFSNTFMNRSLPEVAVQSVQSGTISAKIRGTGAVTANESFEVKSPQTREVLSVPVKVGDEVAVGDILLHYSDADSAQIKETEAALDALVLEYKKALINATDSADYAIEKRAIELAQKALDKARAERSTNAVNAQELADAKEAVKKATTDYETQSAKVEKLTEELAEMSQGTDQSTAIAAKEKEISFVYSRLTTALASHKQGDDNLTSWANKWMEAVNLGGSIDTYKTALAQKLSAILDAEGMKITTLPGGGVPDPPTGITYDYATVKAMVDAYETINSLKEQLADLNHELDILETNNINNVNYASTKKQLQDAKDKLASLKKIKESVEATLAELEKKKAAFEDADKLVDTNQSALEQAMFDLAQKQKADGKQQSIDALNLEAQRKQIDNKKEELESLKGGGEGASVESQVNGVVTEINASAGSVAEKDAVLMKVEVPDRGYSVSFSVTTEQSKKLIVGDAAEITNYYYGEMPTATLAGIRSDPQNPTTNKILTFKLQGEVESGAQLSIAIGERGGNYETIVPNSAIRTDSNGKFVLAVIAKNGPLGNRYIAQRIEVKVLASDDNSSAVSGALAWNDMVITTSTKPIEPGTQVRLAD